jgi:hypothetical protein
MPPGYPMGYTPTPYLGSQSNPSANRQEETGDFGSTQHRADAYAASFPTYEYSPEYSSYIHPAYHRDWPFEPTQHQSHDDTEDIDSSGEQHRDGKSSRTT